MTISEKEKQKDLFIHAAANSNIDTQPDLVVISKEIKLLQSAKQKILTELSHYKIQHLSIFEKFYYPEDHELLNAYGKNLINWLKGIRTPYMPLHMSAERLRGELTPLQNRTRTMSHGLNEMENQLACRGLLKSNLAASLFPLTTNKIIERRREEAKISIQHGEITEPGSQVISKLHNDLQEFRDARKEYRREAESLRSQLDGLLRLRSRPSTPLLTPIGMLDSADLSRVLHEIVKEVIQSMAEKMKNDVNSLTGTARKSLVQRTLEALERPHFLIEQELKKAGLEEGEISEIEGAFNLALRLD